MLLLRDVQKSDLPGLKRLAAALNTVNLPDNEKLLSKLIQTSQRSFSERISDPLEREYLFVLEDARKKRLIGTSMVIARHGTYESPHIFYELSQREHYSATLGRHFKHTVLSIGYNYDGPTEIGGLVVDRAHRGSEERPGKQLSYVRFLFIAMHRDRFRPRVLAELLPPLMPDGRSLLWEAVGKKFTGLTYQDADRLSRRNKEFIKELFPPSDLYATLFPERTQQILGKVGPQTRGVQAMLERIGFRYVERIDPFDGGPHFEAATEDVSLIRQFRRLRVGRTPPTDNLQKHLVAVEPNRGLRRFLCVCTPCEVRDDEVLLPPKAMRLLGLRPKEMASVIPFDGVESPKARATAP
ncbi:MAG: arginine N-succinyltransferase [Myxococcaceae bacterium]